MKRFSAIELEGANGSHARAWIQTLLVKDFYTTSYDVNFRAEVLQSECDMMRFLEPKSRLTSLFY